jgi:hypothetical protein
MWVLRSIQEHRPSDLEIRRRETMPIDAATFTHNYSKVLVNAWTDKNYLSQLLKDPTTLLAQAGLPVKPGAQVEVSQSMSGGGDINAAVDAWNKGADTGKYVLYIPPQPQLGLQTSAAAKEAAADTSYCCCCCPCCSCT